MSERAIVYGVRVRIPGASGGVIGYLPSKQAAEKLREQVGYTVSCLSGDKLWHVSIEELPQLQLQDAQAIKRRYGRL